MVKTKEVKVIWSTFYQVTGNHDKWYSEEYVNGLKEKIRNYCNKINENELAIYVENRIANDILKIIDE